MVRVDGASSSLGGWARVDVVIAYRSRIVVCAWKAWERNGGVEGGEWYCVICK